MISGVQTSPWNGVGMEGRQTVSFSIDGSQLAKLVEALEEAGITPLAMKTEGSGGQESGEGGQGIAAVPAFAPAFHPATLYSAYDGARYPLNSDFFATQETAQWVADKYGTGEIVEQTYLGQGSPFISDTKQFFFKMADGQLANAGIIAAFYARNPEDRFPGVADTLVRMSLANGG